MGEVGSLGPPITLRPPITLPPPAQGPPPSDKACGTSSTRLAGSLARPLL